MCAGQRGAVLQREAAAGRRARGRASARPRYRRRGRPGPVKIRLPRPPAGAWARCRSPLFSKFPVPHHSTLDLYFVSHTSNQSPMEDSTASWRLGPPQVASSSSSLCSITQPWICTLLHTPAEGLCLFLIFPVLHHSTLISCVVFHTPANMSLVMCKE